MTANVVKLMRGDAPTHLSPEAKAWWKRLRDEYALDDEAARLLLLVALEAFDRMRECQKAIAKDGMIARGSKRQPRAHPLLAVERDSRAQMLAAMKALNLDLEPPRDGPGRPGGVFYPGGKD
ncbi:MAG TPA: phage terminase small subunit P27 family [Burkholderiales bacterium]|nr:phage terminase small subunit P27 family [Burkholderiales bacterium]